MSSEKKTKDKRNRKKHQQSEESSSSSLSLSSKTITNHFESTNEMQSKQKQHKQEDAKKNKNQVQIDVIHIKSNNKEDDSTSGRKKRKQNIILKENGTDDEIVMTKRRKRQQPNDKHSWPQQPKIQNPEQRATAYLRVAGLVPTSKVSTTLKPNLIIDNNNEANTPPPKSQTQQQDDEVAIGPTSTETKFGRLLGNPNQRIRHEAIHQMSLYLKAKTDLSDPDSTGISEIDLLKLWKGVWYCLYMADKAPVQDELSKRIADLLFSVAGTEEEDEYAARAYMKMCGESESDDDDDDVDDEENNVSNDDDAADEDSVDMEEIESTLEDEEEEDVEDNVDDNEDDENMNDVDAEDIDEQDDEDGQELNVQEVKHCRGAHLASLFVKTFFQTIRREWGKLDKYRVDKFYTLIRYMMFSIYKYMAIRHWRHGIVQLFNHALYDEVLLQQPDGIRYHIIDIVIDEIVNVHTKENIPLPLTEPLFIDCLEPFFAMAQTGASIGHDILQKRIVENVFVKFLERYSIVSDTATEYYTKLEEHQKQCSTVNDDNVNMKTKKLKGDKAGYEKEKSAKSDPPQIKFLDDVHVKTIADFIFDLASDPETYDRYRKSLYDTHKLYIRRLQEVDRDVDLPNASSDDDNEGLDEEIEDCGIDDDELYIDTVENGNHAVLEESFSSSRKNGVDDDEPMDIVDKKKKKNKKKKKSKDDEAEKLDTNTKNVVVEEIVHKLKDACSAAIEFTKSDKNKKKSKQGKDKIDIALSSSLSSSLSPTIKVTLAIEEEEEIEKNLGGSERKKARKEAKRKSIEIGTNADTKGKPEVLKDEKDTKKSDYLFQQEKQSKNSPKESHRKIEIQNDGKKQKKDKHIDSPGSTKKEITLQTHDQESSSPQKSYATPKKQQVQTIDTDEKDHNNNTSHEDDETETEPSSTSTASKKKRKKKKKKDSDKEATSPREFVTGSTDDIIHKSDNDQKMTTDDDLVVISLKDQKKASKKGKDKKTPDSNQVDVSKKHTTSMQKTPFASTASATTITSSGRRVRFGETNRSRSWKMSMKNLFTMDTPIYKTPPEQGILRKKDQMHKELLRKANEKKMKNGTKNNYDNNLSSASNKTNNGSSSKKQHRKKATDYFS